MTQDFSEKYSKRFLLMHRFMYAFVIFLVVLLYIAGINKSVFLTLYYGIITIAFIAVDEYFFKRNYAISQKFGEIKSFIQLGLLSLGFFNRGSSPLLFLAVLFLQFIIAYEFIVFNDIFYESQLTNKRLIATVTMIVGIIGYFWGTFSTEWVLTFFVLAVIVFAGLLMVTDYYSKSVLEYNYQVTNLYFAGEKLEEDKTALIEYQEKVKSVNTELNFQRIKLAKLNSDLETSTSEMSALVDIMKEFSSSFDVKKSMNIMMDKIVEVKHPDVISFFIDKNVFNNKDYAICTRASEKDFDFFNGIMKDMFDILKEDEVTDPVILSGASVLRHEAFQDKPYTEVVLFPAYNQDEIYGVMLCASKKVDFFYNGYTFYESALIDFSSALTNTRLYIRMEEMANIDSLTGLYNRFYFNRIFPKLCKDSVENETPFSVALIDVDKFKSINDTHGHLAGDKVLKTVTYIMKEFAESSNGMAVRYGGEEFLIILPDKREQEAFEILKQIQQKIKSTAIDHSGKIIKINVSIGLAIYPDTCQDINRLVDSADETMYYSKEHGRGMVVVQGKEEEYEKLFKSDPDYVSIDD